MASCMDCLGFEFCSDRLGTTKYYDNAIAANNVEELCQKFKNRKRFIEVIRCKDCKWLNKTKMICMNKNNRVFNTGKSVSGMTNFEKIKQMSVEEMAEYIIDEFRIDCEQCECRFNYNDCRHCIKNLLESEVEE